MEPINENRMAKCRAKKKSNPDVWEEHLRKDRERNRARRSVKKEERLSDPNLLKADREKERLRKRAARERKKQSKLVTSTVKNSSRLGTYSCTNTLRKAVQKLKQSLPYSPSKKLAVIREFMNDNEREGLAKKIFLEKNICPGKRFISKETTERVLAYYQNDKVSRQAPGKRDKKSVRDPMTGKRSLIQVRHMLVTISEAFEMFKIDYPNNIISKSKFYKLRPEQVLPVSETPHNVCVCKYHANFSSLTNAIGKHFQESSFPKNYHDLLEKVCCDISNEKCMTNQCKKCTTDLFDIVPQEFKLDVNIKWKEWKEVNNHLTLIENVSSVENAITKANSILPNFKTHSFVKNRQYDHFETLKENVTDKTLVVQFDFAENYSIIHQDEIQSAHWHHEQVAIFTCVIWGKDKVDSYVVVSDDLSHSKYSVWTFLKGIFGSYDTFGIQKIDVFTDNCAAQFKSRYMIANLCFLEDDLDMKVSWNHFAASHGKGAVDGIGGIVKGKVWIAVKSRKVLVNSAKDFYECATKECEKINILYIPKEDVEENKALLDTRFCRAVEIPGIRSYHFFQRADETHVYAQRTSVSKKIKIRVLQANEKTRLRYTDVYTSSEDEAWPSLLEDIDETTPQQYDVLASDTPVCANSDDVEEGDWVVVIYDDWYPGVVERRDENFLSVNFMHKTGTKFFWPTEGDIQTLQPNDILCKIDVPPHPVSNRHFGMLENSVNKIQELYEKFK